MKPNNPIPRYQPLNQIQLCYLPPNLVDNIHLIYTDENWNKLHPKISAVAPLRSKFLNAIAPEKIERMKSERLSTNMEGRNDRSCLMPEK